MILKNYRFQERYKVQFHASMFNMTNTLQFARANTNISRLNFGELTGTTDVGPLNVQLGLRFQF